MSDSTAREIAQGLIDAANIRIRQLESALADAEARVRQENERLRAENHEAHAVLTGKGEMSWAMAHPDGQFQTELGKAASTLSARLAAVEQQGNTDAAIIRAQAATIASYKAQGEAALQRLAAVEQALREYGEHKEHCRRLRGKIPCDCGLSAALGDPQ